MKNYSFLQSHPYNVCRLCFSFVFHKSSRCSLLCVLLRIYVIFQLAIYSIFIKSASITDICSAYGNLRNNAQLFKVSQQLESLNGASRISFSLFHHEKGFNNKIYDKSLSIEISHSDSLSIFWPRNM